MLLVRIALSVFNFFISEAVNFFAMFKSVWYLSKKLIVIIANIVLYL